VSRHQILLKTAPDYYQFTGFYAIKTAHKTAFIQIAIG